MIGCSMPNISVIAVFTCLSLISSVAVLLARSPLLSKWADFMLEGPGIARLLIELPVGFGDRGRAHQTIRIQVLDRLRPLPVRDQLPHPLGIDAGVDDKMRHMDVLGAEFAGHRLRHRA